jgi:hypothetical protein
VLGHVWERDVLKVGGENRRNLGPGSSAINIGKGDGDPLRFYSSFDGNQGVPQKDFGVAAWPTYPVLGRDL